MNLNQHPLGNVYISILNDFVNKIPTIRSDMNISIDFLVNRITMTQCNIKSCSEDFILLYFTVRKDNQEYIFQINFTDNEWYVSGMLREFDTSSLVNFYEPFSVNRYSNYLHKIMFDLKYYMEDLLPEDSFTKEPIKVYINSYGGEYL